MRIFGEFVKPEKDKGLKPLVSPWI